jgi:branched-chain amino acid transport system permease protein
MGRWRSAFGAVHVPGTLIAVVCGAGLVASLGPTSLDRYVIASVVNLVFALGLYTYSGPTGIVSFGHFAFATVGAYSCGLLTMNVRLKEATLPDLPAVLADLHLPPVAAIAVAGVAAAIVALALAPAIGRVSGLAASLATLSLLLVARNVARNLETFTRGTAGLSSVPRWTTLGSALVMASVFIAGSYAYQRSASGLRLRSSRSDLVAARAAGVNVGFDRAIAWVVSAFIMGCGGALFVMLLGSIGPETLFVNQTFLVVSMIVLGGTGSLSGAVLGALSVSLISELLTRAESSGHLLGVVPVPTRPGLRNLVLAAILIVIVTVRPAGLTRGAELRPFRRRRVGPMSS